LTRSNPFRPPAAEQATDLAGELPEFAAYNRERRAQLVAAALVVVLATGVVASAGALMATERTWGGGIAGGLSGLAVGAWYFWTRWRRSVRLGERGVVIGGDWVPWSDVFYLRAHSYVEHGGRGMEPRSSLVVYIGYVDQAGPRLTALGERAQAWTPTWLGPAGARIRAPLSAAEERVIAELEGPQAEGDSPETLLKIS